MPTDFYALLKVEEDASPELIEAAYRHLAEQFDPQRLAQDLAPDLRALVVERRQALDTAYATLSDAQRRAAYDAGLAAARGGPQSRPRSADSRPAGRKPGRLRPAAEWWRSPWVALAFMLVGVASLAASMTLVLTGRQPAAAPSAQDEQRRAAWSRLPEAVREEISDPAVLDLLARQDGRITALRSSAQGASSPEPWIELGNAIFDYLELVRASSPQGQAYIALAPRWSEATEAYTAALKLRPDNGLVRSDYAFSLMRHAEASGDMRLLEQSVAEADQALRDDPQGLRTVLNVGIVYSAAQPPRTEQARLLWQSIVDRAPQSSEASLARSLLEGRTP